jgi:3,4-dihydroxy 2-butanone 4-phosphate synthase/GTP cyclohydrolase II
MSSFFSSYCSPIEEICKHLLAGRGIILVDDDDRENEGDVVFLADRLTASSVAFMVRECGGLICVSMDRGQAVRLGLGPQTEDNRSSFGTPFAVTVGLRIHGAGPSLGAAARAEAIRHLVATSALPEDFTVPGIVVPLIADERGVFGRRGQTEGSYDLARLCGAEPGGVICEILNHDGTVSRGTEILDFARTHQIPITSIEKIREHRLKKFPLVRRTAEGIRETPFGPFNVLAFEDEVDLREHLVFSQGELPAADKRAPLMRIHSECLTGDIFGSRRCDCGVQFADAMRLIARERYGAVLYLRQEGRGIGLGNKLRAYQLQDEGFDTVDANTALGFAPDERDYHVAAGILRQCGIDSVRLITNNPEKVKALESYGIRVVERIPTIISGDPLSASYIETKRARMGHLVGDS